MLLAVKNPKSGRGPRRLPHPPALHSAIWSFAGSGNAFPRPNRGSTRGERLPAEACPIGLSRGPGGLHAGLDLGALSKSGMGFGRLSRFHFTDERMPGAIPSSRDNLQVVWHDLKAHHLALKSP
jgi:hypothetical protein